MENLPIPNDREEKILYAIATGDMSDLPTPKTRTEKLLMGILENGSMAPGGGTSFGILGYYATADILMSSVTDPKTGDAYGVGSSAPYEMYVYDGVNNTWVNNGAMIQGPEGPEGPQGPQGLEGEQGPQGDPGTTYTPIIGTIQTVDNLSGASASVVVDGTTKKAKFNFNIPQGPTGAKGDPGEQGEKGEKGDTYIFEIGNVITVDSFEQASANISLDETNKKATLNISLPRGMTGQQGAKGDPGDPGIQGLRGEQGLQGPPGEQGPPGVQGEQGIQGVQGEKGNDGYPFLIYKEYADISEFTPDDFPEVGLMFMVKSWVEDKGYPIYRFAEDRTNYSLVTYMNTEGIKGETGPQGLQGDQGVPGVAGRDGRDGVTYTPEIGVIRTVESSASASVTIELKEDEGRAIFNFDIPKGADGINGIDGINGVDGVSPTVEVVSTDTGHTVKITDKDGVKSFDVNNGTNGQDGTNGTNGVDGQNGADGFSPVITVEATTDGHTVKVEDANGLQQFEVPNGKDAEVNQYGLVTNAQNFKIDLTKNNAVWYGMFTFNFVYGTTPCEITVAITDKVYYTITKGQNLVSALTYTQDGANYTIGIDLTAKVYGTQVVEMPSEFGTINSLTAETFVGATTAISKGYGFVTKEYVDGTEITQSVIDTYGTEILKYPIGKWRISNVNLGNQLTDLPRASTGAIITIESIYPTKSPWTDNWAYRQYKFESSMEDWVYIRTLNSGATAGVIQRDSGWKQIATKSTYNSIAELNKAKGTNIELVNEEDNTKKIVDALSVGEQFISFYHNNANQNRFGIDVSYGNLIHELRITKCLDADLTANYATVTAFMNTGCVMSRVYYKNYSTDWSSTKDYVESLT